MKEYLKSNPVLHPIFRNAKKAYFSMCIKSAQLRGTERRPNMGKYKDIHHGKRCFIVATGPSLRMEDLANLKNEITFSMNSIINLYDRTDFRPTYYIIQDGNVERRLHDKLIGLTHEASFMGIGDVSCVKEVITSKQAKAYENSFEFYNLLVAYHLYEMSYGDGEKIPSSFSCDGETGFYDGCTVTYSAIQLACYMGFDEIYLLGCDTNHAGHVDDKSNPNKKGTNDTWYALIHAYEVAKEYADEHGIKIYNATRGGMLEVFPRVDFDTLF